MRVRSVSNLPSGPTLSNRGETPLKKKGRKRKRPRSRDRRHPHAKTSNKQ